MTKKVFKFPFEEEIEAFVSSGDEWANLDDKKKRGAAQVIFKKLAYCDPKMPHILEKFQLFSGVTVAKLDNLHKFIIRQPPQIHRKFRMAKYKVEQHKTFFDTYRTKKYKALGITGAKVISDFMEYYDLSGGEIREMEIENRAKLEDSFKQFAISFYSSKSKKRKTKRKAK